MEVEGSLCWARVQAAYFFHLLFSISFCFVLFCVLGLSPLTVDEERDEGINDVDRRDTALF